MELYYNARNNTRIFVRYICFTNDQNTMRKVIRGFTYTAKFEIRIKIKIETFFSAFLT